MEKNGNNEIFIDYDAQINKMIVCMIENILKYCSKKGLPGSHHFYIKFKTDHPDVNILDSNGEQDFKLLEKYPKEMTIVLENSFSNLIVEDWGFSVQLNFNSEARKLIIPFDSILTFFDPCANFSVKLEPEKLSGLRSDDPLNVFDYDFYDFYNEEYEDNEDGIYNIFKYDYEKYKIDKDQKIIYFDELRAKNLD